MSTPFDIAKIHKHISNRFDEQHLNNKLIAGIIGDGPSHYSKSPALWNAAFGRLGISAVYLPFDVVGAQVGNLLGAFRDCERFLGINVTVPHKECVIEYLDELDAGAARIQAVNTVVRTATGKLIGYNTDGEGFIESILERQPGQSESFLTTLVNSDVLLLGAGGSARAVAFHVSDHIGKGRLIVSNRTLDHAESLVAAIQKLGGHAIAIDENGISTWAPKVGLIVNSTTKGQSGVRKLINGMVTLLAPYSALASAHPAALPASDTVQSDFESKWYSISKADVAANNEASLVLAKSIPVATRFYDLIYHPEETVFLHHGRVSGHPTMNGKSMIVCQAVIAFCKRICQRQLAELGQDNLETFRTITDVMYRAW